MIEEKISFQRDDFTLNGMIFIPKRGETHPAVIVAHGLPSTPLPVEEKGYDVLGRHLCSLGFVSLIFNFSGCQGSGGFFSLKSWVDDLDTVSQYLWSVNEVDPSRIAYLAFSMGTIPTIYLVAHSMERLKKFPKVLVICACPADLPERRLAELRIGIHLTAEAGGIRITSTYDNEILSELNEFMPIKWISAILIPKFILHGARDDLINVKNAKKLYEAALEPKKLNILKDAGHKLRQDPTAMQRIFKILQDSLL